MQPLTLDDPEYQCHATSKPYNSQTAIISIRILMGTNRLLMWVSGSDVIFNNNRVCHGNINIEVKIIRIFITHKQSIPKA